MVNWAKRGYKIIGTFFTGYGGGFATMIPGNIAFSPEELRWGLIFILPCISGLVVTFPQIGKIFNELATMDEGSNA